MSDELNGVRMTTLLLIEGTWGGTWARDRQPGGFRDFLRQQGFDCHLVEWSTNPDGIPSLFGAKGNRDWVAGGMALRYFLRHVPYNERNILAHSHGAGPVLYQAALEDSAVPPIPIRRLLTVCSPPRKDLEIVAGVAIRAGRIAAWRHIYASGWDWMARLGQGWDGHWGWRRKWDMPVETARVFNQVGERGIGHSDLFTGELRQRFVDGGHLDFLHAR